ncbi:zz type zinc finger domain-containing protein [Botrytis cinerea]
MASMTAPTPDTLVTSRSILRLRFLLAIPATSEATFERYSDSAAAFIVLDATNPSVYKQLYRAAKAKLKLRLKVTIKDKEPVLPKPASVEDEEPTSAKPVVAQSQSPPVTMPVPPPSTTEIPNARRSVAFDSEARAEARAEAQFKESIAAVQVQSKVQEQIEAIISLQKSFDEMAVSNNHAAYQTATRHTKPLPAYLMDRVLDDEAPLSSKSPEPVVSSFSVYCNSCSVSIPDIHYHCSTCDNGDFDLCPECNDAGVTCNGDHWLIKRIVDKGQYIHSTTEKLAPKQLSGYRDIKPQFSDSKVTLVAPAVEEKEPVPTRTCNSCISELSEENFVTCIDCEDFDLCIQCHVSLKHGHNPKHAFAFVNEDANFGPMASALLAAGRNASHSAICDGCDRTIFGVRHKCLDCPDWDYCDACIANAAFIHQGHRFVPLYEPVSRSGARQQAIRVRHHGIFCDGPLCKHKHHSEDDDGNISPAYITGDRYKCAVCHDTDFCAVCEASPSNSHNKTHPLIKFKTPVRNVSVTTLGDHPNGKPMAPMGDRFTPTISKATETTQLNPPVVEAKSVAEVEPVAEEVEPVEAKEEVVEEVTEEAPAPVEEELVAHFVRDAVADGTIMTPNSVFEQTWYLRNGGKTSWPAGCSVRFVGGDNMCAVDPEHPASVHELVSAAESTTCYTEVAPGQEYGFTVLMRTPNRAGSFISYWRLTTPTGDKFGHRLWCDITVNEPTPVIKSEVTETEAPKVETAKIETPKVVADEQELATKASSEVEETRDVPEDEGSQMIFPKLEKESPISSIHQAQPSPKVVPTSEEIFNDDFEEFNQNFEDDEAEDGFMTDEEYDILDASDEEYLAEQESESKK